MMTGAGSVVDEVAVAFVRTLSMVVVEDIVEVVVVEARNWSFI